MRTIPGIVSALRGRARAALRRGARRGRLLPIGIVMVAVVLAGGSIGLGRPAPTTATRPTPIVPLTRAELRTDLRTGQAPNATVRIEFSSPMSEESVRAALDVQPPTAVQTHWNDDRTRLSVSPLGRWATGTYYTVTVEPGALAANGRPLSTPVRAAFLTRPATGATILPTRTVDDRVRLDTGFAVQFDRPLDPATVGGAFRIEPVVAGAWERVGRRTAGDRFAFTPLGALAPDTEYAVSLAHSLRDADGAPVVSEPLTVRTPPSPSVVGFRPSNATRAVDRAANLAVAFSQPMDRASTASAFAVSVDGKAIEGAVSWAEGDTVLQFDPAATFGYRSHVLMRVTAGARSAAGVPVASTASARFTTEEPPPPPPPPPPTTRSAGGGAGRATAVDSTSSGGSVADVERYYLRLMNCTRTGGTVTSSGDCSSAGGRNVAPLKLDAGITSKVARPYAKRLATSGQCSHFVGGNPGDRLRRAGYSSHAWAENLGCRSGNPYAAVLASHLYFQSERSWSPPGGHYVNLMNPKYDRVGIGVWVSGGRVRLVVDFYHPR